MAEQFYVGVQLVLNRNDAELQIARQSPLLGMVGSHFVKAVQTIGTSDETLDIGEIGTIGFVYLRNLDATNYIEIGSDGTNYPLKLLKGNVALFRWNAAAIHAKANTASCLLEYAVLEH